MAIEIETGNAFSVAADVLVLKHAQGAYGVDAAAKDRLGLQMEMDLPPGAYLTVPGSGGIQARSVVFLGVPDLPNFGYDEIRQFGRRAVSLVVAEFPDCRELALTLHGVGYGLDEWACFEAEVGGIIEAIDGATTSRLQRVRIVETDEQRARRLRGRLEELFPAATSSAHPRSAKTTADSGHAFVATPFSPTFDDAFHYAIEPAVHKSGLLCERIDQKPFTGSIPDRIKEKIRSATLVVANLTEANPNVYLEVGFAWGAEVPTVLVCHDVAELKFDVQSERCIVYSNIIDLEEKLTSELRGLVGR